METYIRTFENFKEEHNRILVEDDEVKNANHILILMGTGNFGFLCASDPRETKANNKARMEQLQKDVLKLKCSYIPFKYGLNYVSTGESSVRNEDDCLFIQGIELKELLKLAAKYEQSTAVYGNKEEIKSYDVQSGKPDITLGQVDMKLAMATVLFYPGTFR